MRGIGLRGAGILSISSMSGGTGWNMSPTNDMVGALGDSLSCSMTVSNWRNFYTAVNVAAYQFYALTLPKTGDIVSQGIFIPGMMRVQNGANLDTIKGTLLTALLAASPRPGLCLVLGGTNDLTGLVNPAAYTTAVAKLEYIYQTLLSNQILPIAFGVPTTNNATNRARVPTLNALIEAKALELGIPYLDFYAITDNGVDGWIAGYSCDANVHWGVVGAAVAGQAVRDNILTPLEGSFTAPNLVTAADDTGGGILYENGSMIDDANADGKPDGGQPQSATYWTTVTGAADVTFSLVAEPGVVDGNWWRINKTAHTANLYLLGASMAWLPSTDYEIGFMCKILNPAATANIAFNFYNTADSISQVNMDLYTLAGDVAPFKIQRKFTSPANANYIRPFIKINNDIADLYIGQLTIRRV